MFFSAQRHPFAMVVLAFAAIFLSTLTPAPACASTADRAPSSNTLILRANQNEYGMGKHLMLLEDRSAALQFTDILKRDANFTNCECDVPNFYVTRSAVWAKVRIENADAPSYEWYLEHMDNMAQHLDIWVVGDDGRVTHKQAGTLRERTSDVVDVRGHVFQLSIPPGEGVTLYVRGQTAYFHIIPLRLWSPEAFSSHHAIESALHGIYAGIAFAMIIYNLFVYMTMRESAYIHYVGYMTSLLLSMACLTGFFSEFISPTNGMFTTTVNVLSYLACAIFACTFSKRFLDLQGLEKRLVSLFAWMLFVIGFLLIAVDPHSWMKFYTSSVLFWCIWMLYIALRKVSQGDRAARYYVAGYGWLIVSSMIFVLSMLGILPFSALSFYAPEIGNAFETIFLSLALAQRVKQMKDEKEAATAANIASQQALVVSQADMLAAQQSALENKQLALQTIENYNSDLEREVKARTAELIDTQQRLVATEKMAALGVFTAGMAHEINNPANFVSTGAQNADAQLNRFERFVAELLDDDAPDEIKQEFTGHFNKLKDSVGIITTGVDRITHVIKHLRATHPEGNVGMQPTDVIATLESAWNMLLPTIQRPIDLTTLFESRPTMPCLVAELQQVFLALLTNAVHAIEDAVPKRASEYRGVIHLTSRLEAMQLIITVTDNGIGISPADIGKVFDPFFTTKTVGRGAGLGLSMARDVVHQHAGTLVVESSSDAGAVFTLTLPLEQYD
jgi:two-component system NtrC family sensor kinase